MKEFIFKALFENALFMKKCFTAYIWRDEGLAAHYARHYQVKKD